MSVPSKPLDVILDEDEEESAETLIREPGLPGEGEPGEGKPEDGEEGDRGGRSRRNSVRR